jgi:hypothetical protein
MLISLTVKIHQVSTRTGKMERENAQTFFAYLYFLHLQSLWSRLFLIALAMVTTTWLYLLLIETAIFVDGGTLTILEIVKIK